MVEILWHGRGGQGAFTAARLLGAAYALEEDHYALAFPSFGPERRGAPVLAFTKLSHQPIGNRSAVEQADYILVLDETLFTERAFSQLKPGGKILLNTGKPVTDQRIIAIDGNHLAAELRLPVTNTILLGAFAAVYDGITLAQLEQAVCQSMPEKLQEKNIQAIRKAFSLIRKEADQ